MSVSHILFQPMMGLRVFNAKKGHGSFVTFGLTTTPEAPVEEFHFWIYLCDWWICLPEGEMVNSESPDDEIILSVSSLNGRALNAVVLHHTVTQEEVLHGVSLIFSDELTMRLCQYKESSAEDAIFMTCNAAGDWISYLVDGSIRKEPKT